jgi:hypothetical protein
MQGDGRRRIAGGAETASCGRLLFVGGKRLLCLALGLMAAGCGSIGQALGPSAQTRGDVSIAFESIDGLPRDVSQKLLHDLNEEAAAFRIAVVPAGGEAVYRMRGYLAAHAEGSATSIAWAWDVYDAALHRAFRLSGEERAGPTAAGRSWAMADDALLHRIARTGMEQLAGFMASAPVPPAPAPAAPERSGSGVASRDVFRSGADGVFPNETAAALDSVAVPLPDRRPIRGDSSAARLADAAAGR